MDLWQDTADLAPDWAPKRAAALERLQAFVPHAGTAYAKQRNFDFGPGGHGKVSRLSPWLRHRALLETEVLASTLAQHTPNAAEKFVQEVFWRGYFKGWLEHRPDVWRTYKSDLVALVDRLERDAALARRYDQAVSGQTGIACFDAWAMELVETGYLHNHARMWFASIWIFTLKLPWPLGADFFYRHLIDGDPASNTCSWRWVGGLHTVGKTYLARAANIEKFTAGRFCPNGQLAQEAPALRDERPVAIMALNWRQTNLEGRRVGWLMTEEDCHISDLTPQPPAARLVLASPTQRSVLPLGKHAIAFAPAALQDAYQYLSKHTDAPCEISVEADWAAILTTWMKIHELEVCATPRLTLGPVAKRLRQACRKADIELVEVPRRYDQLTWPHTKRGFFGLKKKITQILTDLDLRHPND
ncbi:MAG: FAD-binding domain-containing protein [Pseudomonadota bacterium]